MANNFEANSWEFLQKVVRISHNRNVKKYFKDINSDTETNTGRAAIKTALLIRDNDSALEVITKLLHFNTNLNKQDLVVAIPEEYQVKAETNRPQLVIIYRPSDKKLKYQHYPLTIPHYSGSKTPKFRSYNKGNHWARIILKDNSYIVVNGRTELEAINVVKNFLRTVDKKYRVDSNQIKTGRYISKRFKELKMLPFRADFFAQGKRQGQPNWRHYF